MYFELINIIASVMVTNST